MSYVDDPAFGMYGAWEAANQECVSKGLSVTANTKMIQLLFASICACQVLFMASRAPRVTWEAVYLPLVETILYGMASTGNGSIRLANGRMVPIARFCSWLITCPIMLFQVVGIFELKWKTISCKNMVMAAETCIIFLKPMFRVMAASLIRTVFGIGASVTTNPVMRWVQYFLALSFLLFEFSVVYQIFQAGLKKFGAVKTKLNNIVYSRILFLRFLFFLSWAAFPLIWLFSCTGLCVISEDVSVLAYLIADVICKNTYGITNANTLFRVLNGKWEAETEEDANKPKLDSDHQHVGESYFEQMLAGFRGSKVRQPVGEAAMKEVRIDDAVRDRSPPRSEAGGYRGSPAAERAAAYSDKMRNKNPETFMSDRDLPHLSSSERPRHEERGLERRLSQQEDLRVVREDYAPRYHSRGGGAHRSPSEADEDLRERDRSRAQDSGRSHRSRDRDDYYRDDRDDYYRDDRDDYYRDDARGSYRSHSRDPREERRGSRTGSPERTRSGELR